MCDLLESTTDPGESDGCWCVLGRRAGGAANALVMSDRVRRVESRHRLIWTFSCGPLISVWVARDAVYALVNERP